MPWSVFRYFAAACVALIGSARSSRYQSAVQPVLERGAAHELPHAARLGARQRRRLEGAFDQRDVGEIEGQPFCPEGRLDHRQVLHAARQALGQELTEPALEQLDVAQHAVVGRDRNVVGGRLRGRPAPPQPWRAWASRTRTVSMASSASIAAGSDLVSEKPSPVASAACSRTLMRSTRRSKCSRSRAVAARAVGRLEQRVERAVELDLGAFEVAERQLLLAGLEMAIGRRRSGWRSDPALALE